MTRFQAGMHSCMNCGNPTGGKYQFQGVVVCSSCQRLAKASYERAEHQCTMMLTVYKESLRVALASGRLRPADRPKQADSSPLQIKDLISGVSKILESRS